MSVEDIRWLARKAASKGLRLRTARNLFDALYVADAIAMEGGNMTKAAERAGIGGKGASLRRMLKGSAARLAENFEDSQDV